MSLEPLTPVREEARELAERFAAGGHRVFLVGGVVRDALLDLPLDTSFDLDLTTDAQPPTVKSILEGWADTLWTQGERFGTIGARRGDRRVEITTHRTERYQPGSRKPDVDFADAIEVDLSRRDFTINAMAVELPDGGLVDPFGGAADLANRRLRTPLDPEATFSDDPLRMLRAARFLAQFELTAEPALVAAMIAMAERLSIVADERIRDELDRLLSISKPGPGFEMLFQTGLGERVLGPVGDGTAAVGRLSQVGDDPTTRLAALLADAGTPADVQRALAERRASTTVSRAVAAILTSAHQAVGQPPQDVAELRRWVVNAGPHVDESVAVASAMGDVGLLAADVAVLVEAEPDLCGPPVLDGEEIMGLLELEPGPAVGAAVEELRRHRLDSGPLSPDEARAHLLAWRDFLPTG
ncbi:MAG: CCA tRNA nucleotidyltransferase [Acidimicrobiia bacterium]|nr:CCA tRNA nucleotidyltransferase [Acidimicrobiia bacterium]MYG71851.1 CCA tRNA nucleotidyltransferase [Acidimicrobiia bacterium]